MQISFQLYSARNAADQIQCLNQLAALGYTHVEGFAGVYEDPSAYAAALAENNMQMLSGHFSVQALEEQLDDVLKTATTLSMQMIFAPNLQVHERPTNAVGWKAFAHRLAAIGEKVTAAGFKFGWHNHQFEFIELASGELPIDIILEHAPALMWEADLAWIKRAGKDPKAFITRYADRIIAIHVKDIAKEGEKLDEDGWADVGTGVVDWRDLLETQQRLIPNALRVMEHDNPSDITRFARESINNLKELSNA